MNKFVGILFFYTLAFFKKEEKFAKNFGILRNYLQEKSKKYLDIEINEVQWKLLKKFLKDFPEPESTDYLSQENLIKMITIFDDVFGLNNINYELRMYGVEEEVEKDQLNEVFERFQEFVEIMGSSNGISLLLGDWLGKVKYDRKLIEREINLKQLES